MTDAGDRQVFRARHAVLLDGVRAADIVVSGGRIAEVLPFGAATAGAITDCGDHHLMPGLVDTHVHVNEPGRTEWEGFATATRAAAAGGITTIVDMPLNSVPATTSIAALEAKQVAARTAGLCVDVAFWAGVVPGNTDDLAALGQAGVGGFKCFLVPSGVDEFPAVGEEDLRRAMPILARLGLPLLAHAELPGPIETATAALRGADPRAHATWLASRPPSAEVEAIRLLIRLCAETGCAVHVVHLAAAEALPDLRAARARGLPITVETCPHYLGFAAEEVPDGDTCFKCAPPLRPRANRDRLWEALRAGDIDLVATDHSPCPPALKAGDFFTAWGGIASLEVALAAVWTGARERGFSPADLVRWMAERPARLAGFAERKGAIAPGADADFVLWDPDMTSIVDGARLHHRHPVTAWHGRTLAGVVYGTWLRGRRVSTREGADVAFAPATGGCLERGVATR